MPAWSIRGNRIIRLAVLALALLAIVACVEIPTFNSKPSITIRLAVPNSVQATYLSERVKAFEQANPSIDVVVFSRLEQFRGDLASAITALTSSGDGLDLIYLTDQDFQSLGDGAVLSDLTSFLRETEDLGPAGFFPISLPVFQSRGRQMVIPAELSPLVVFYNSDLFDRRGMTYPTSEWTVQDFQVAAKQLTDTTGGPQQATYGFVGDMTTVIWPLLLAFGGSIPDASVDPQASTMTSPSAIRAFQFLSDLIVRDQSFPIDPQGRTSAIWYGGRAGMTMLYMNSRNAVPQQQQGGPAVAATPTAGPRQTWGFHWDVVPVPKEAGRSTLVQVAGYAIPKGAKNPDEAWQLIRYLVQTLPDPGAAPGYVPALKSLAQSADFGRLYTESGRRAYLDSVNFGQTVPLVPSAVRITENDIRPMLRGEVSIADGLQAIRARYLAQFVKSLQ